MHREAVFVWEFCYKFGGMDVDDFVSNSATPVEVVAMEETVAKLQASKEQLQVNMEQLEEKDTMLKKSIKMLLNSGLDAEHITSTLGIDLDIVSKEKGHS